MSYLENVIRIAPDLFESDEEVAKFHMADEAGQGHILATALNRKLLKVTNELNTLRKEKIANFLETRDETDPKYNVVSISDKLIKTLEAQNYSCEQIITYYEKIIQEQQKTIEAYAKQMPKAAPAMTKEAAIDKIWGAIEDFVSDSKQIELITKYFSDGLVFFKMEDFDSFCEEHFHGKYFEISKYIMEASEYDDFRASDRWVMWDEINKAIKSSSDLLSLVEDVPALIKNMVKHDDPLLRSLNEEEAVNVIRGEITHHE